MEAPGLLSRSDRRAPGRFRVFAVLAELRAAVLLTDGLFLLAARPLLATFLVLVFLPEAFFLLVFAAWRFLLLGRRVGFLLLVFFFDVFFFDDALAAFLAGDFFCEVRFTEVFLPLVFFLAAAFLLGICSPPR